MSVWRYPPLSCETARKEKSQDRVKIDITICIFMDEAFDGVYQVRESHDLENEYTAEKVSGTATETTELVFAASDLLLLLFFKVFL